MNSTAVENQLSPAPLRDILEKLTLMLAPFAPYTAQDLWNILGHNTPAFREAWPAFDPELAKEEQIDVVVQVNGKLRGRISVRPGTPEPELKDQALANEKAGPFLEGKQIVKVIVVPDKLVNIVVR